MENQLTEETILPESSTPKVELTPEQQMEFQMRIVKEHQMHLNNSIQATLRGLLNMLTAPGVNENKRNRIKKAIETGVLVGIDYGVDVAKINMEKKGIYAQYEGHLAATIAKAKENGMIIIANNFRKEEENISVGGNNGQGQSASSGEKTSSEETETSNEENNKIDKEVEINQEGKLNNG
jgi:hypothetical protein